MSFDIFPTLQMFPVKIFVISQCQSSFEYPDEHAMDVLLSSFICSSRLQENHCISFLISFTMIFAGIQF